MIVCRLNVRKGIVMNGGDLIETRWFLMRKREVCVWKKDEKGQRKKMRKDRIFNGEFVEGFWCFKWCVPAPQNKRE